MFCTNNWVYVSTALLLPTNTCCVVADFRSILPYSYVVRDLTTVSE
jgi:hypothetical protein